MKHPFGKEAILEEMSNASDPQTDRELLLQLNHQVKRLSDAIESFAEKLEQFEKLAEAELHETETASVYTSTRLSYLNQSNQYDITEVLKECSCDIATACAIWYDRKVAEACEELVAYILQD